MCGCRSCYLGVDPTESNDRCIHKPAGTLDEATISSRAAVAYPMRLVDTDNQDDHHAEGYSFFTLDKMAGA